MSGKWHGGKGSRRRSQADDEQYRKNWDRIFGNDKSEVNDNKDKKEK
jgi:hypothetical protein